MSKRKPKYVPIVDAEGNYTVDTMFTKLFPKQAPKEPTAKQVGSAYRRLPSPPPEEEWPVRRYSAIAEDQPPRTGQSNPGISQRDANT